MTSLSWHGSTKIMTSYQMVWCHNRFYLKLWGTVVNQGIWFRGTLSPKNRFVTGAEMNEFFSYYKVEKRFFVKFGGNLFFISMVFLFFFLNPIKSCRYVCFLVTLKTPHH